MGSINTEYAAFCMEGDVYFQKLASHNDEPVLLASCRQSTLSKPYLAISHVQTNLLAVSHGHQILLFDLLSRSARATIPGIGRTVTTLSWSSRNATTLVAGSIDGSICIWNVDELNRPQRRLRGVQRACHIIEFHPTYRHLLVSVHGCTLSIWNLDRRSSYPFAILRNDGRRFESVTWQPESSKLLLTTAPGEELRWYDLSDVELSTRPGTSSGSSGEDDSYNGIFGKPDGEHNIVRLVSSIQLETPLKLCIFLNSCSVLGLAKDGLEVLILIPDKIERKVTKLWSCRLEKTAATLQIQIFQGTSTIVALGPDGIEMHELPPSVLDKMALQYQSSIPGLPSTKESSLDAWISNLIVAPKLAAIKHQTLTTMKPVSVATQRHAAPGFAKTSRQLQARRRSSRFVGLQHSASKRSIPSQRSEEPSAPRGPQSVNTNLELPKPNDEDIGSPMPFLSPSIPARASSPNGIPLLEASTFRPPSTSVPSMAAIEGDASQSDDSDDETFVDAMQGSATLLPGGINVPLPKKCGALFAPNGQLLIYFPPKPKLSSASENLTVEQDGNGDLQREVSRTAKLFPMFGNLIGESQWLSDDSASDGSSSYNGGVTGFRASPNFVLQSSSFPSQPSWKNRVSPIKSGFVPQQSQYKVTISVYEINDISSASLARRKLAEDYHLLCRDNEPGSQACEHNAFLAETAGLQETAQIWQLLAMLMNDRVPLESFHNSAEEDGILAVVQRDKVMLRSDSGVGLTQDVIHSGPFGKLRWSDDPFGGAWLTRRIFEWAEERSDTQLLACVSAVLMEASQAVPMSNATTQHSFVTKLPLHPSEYATDPTSGAGQGDTRTRPIPILRTNTPCTSSAVYESPTKLHRSSNTSSRNPSQPPTPYLQSTSSTPPFSLPAMSQQGSRQSASGSASPEYHRTSFSAAAKYYAQSITDKFSSYGTSPPVKRTSTSPTASNDLSSSLPSGSWSKSVSFATSSATGNVTRPSLLSRSYDGQNDEDAYDSDKTIEDSSMPHTPRSPSGPISVVSKNQKSFTDNNGKIKLIPDDMTAKCYLWCEYYAEQLRSWDLLEQAAELEKIVGIAGDNHAFPITDADLENDGIVPTAFHGHRSNPICGVCLNVVRCMEQVCPSCLHVSHLTCLEAYSAGNDDGDFTCPTSCGCLCSELAFVVQDVRPECPQAKPAFKKKASFTDPRRWRAMVEGDSW